MERRIYHGDISPGDLAEFLVQHYDPQEHLQAQSIGQGGGHAVQIGKGDVPKELRHAVTVAISEDPDGQQGLAVTLGQQQWLTPNLATYAATMGLISVLVTPWALFGLLWPAGELVSNVLLPQDIWKTIDDYVLIRGGTLARTEELTHPHVQATP